MEKKYFYFYDFSFRKQQTNKKKSKFSGLLLNKLLIKMTDDVHINLNEYISSTTARQSYHRVAGCRQLC